jgi:hypothetical protein
MEICRVHREIPNPNAQKELSARILIPLLFEVGRIGRWKVVGFVPMDLPNGDMETYAAVLFMAFSHS